MTTAALIGLDWGTTSFRAYRIDAAGSVVETREAPAGILAVRDGDFAGVLEREVAAWLAAEPDLPVIASGMITSRQGWLEVPYCPCPAGIPQIAGALLRHPTRPALHFVPGLSLIGDDG
ncbi:MAG: 2-dehydro-3-deoxygalactonokinase, partial [Geminicoccaceae bacterium]